ncbi:WYL domain-containing protein [Aliarcobacter cryaerophilus]|uniref:WYL domain-containing protein n=1 Tax=Aliarcobacter cryaerophilus TaxID=28198 RepID=UPI0021B638B0|nr:WYL domain-containing protein [Aliarcobacter cryaerophilus]MCT7521130.1 WYL domain-containing protein [Aliarcobacter cryaerophilus]
MATSQTKRVLELIKRFNDGQKVYIEALQNDINWWNDARQEPMSEKSIRRDLDVIKEYFPFELVRGEKGCYKAVTKSTMDKFINKNTKALLVQTFNIAQRNNLLKSLDIDESDKRILEGEIKKSKDCYEFISKPFESKKGDEELLKDLENAIHNKRYVKITYKTAIGEDIYLLKPYKIIFMNENFYLATENPDERYKFTMLRLAQIKYVELQKEQFHHNPDIKEFIKHLQTPFPLYKPQFREHLIKVIVQVDKEKAKYFKMKKYLPSQNIQKENEDGSLIVSFEVTQEREMEEIVKKWIPNMKVVEPLSLKNKIEAELKKYLNIN